MTDTTAEAIDGDGHEHHDPTLAHHFDSHQQQFDAGKLGIWLFLTTEILFFSGLFCAYAVIRAMHPEIFEYGHYFLDTNLGFLNTCILLLSSLTAAWAVRCVQVGNKKGLVINIVVTILCAFGFMAVKYVEYSHKIEYGMTWGQAFAPKEAVHDTHIYQSLHPEMAAAYAEGKHPTTGLALEGIAKTGYPVVGGHTDIVEDPLRPRNAHLFFTTYFCLTGLHGIHVLAGIVCWLWILWRVFRNDFTKKKFGAIDSVALYWHVVDLIWIYLFPLLYLID